MKKIILGVIALLLIAVFGGYWLVENKASKDAKNTLDDSLFNYNFNNNFYYKDINYNLLSNTAVISDVEILFLKSLPKAIESLIRQSHSTRFSFNDFQSWLIEEKEDRSFNLNIKEIKLHFKDDKVYKIELNQITATPYFYLTTYNSYLPFYFSRPLAYDNFISDVVLELDCEKRECNFQFFQSTNDLFESNIQATITNITLDNLIASVKSARFDNVKKMGIESFNMTVKDKGVYNKYSALQSYINTVIPGEQGEYDKGEDISNIYFSLIDFTKKIEIDIAKEDSDNLKESITESWENNGELNVELLFSRPFSFSGNNQRTRLKVESDSN